MSEGHKMWCPVCSRWNTVTIADGGQGFAWGCSDCWASGRLSGTEAAARANYYRSVQAFTLLNTVEEFYHEQEDIRRKSGGYHPRFRLYYSSEVARDKSASESTAPADAPGAHHESPAPGVLPDHS